MLVDNRTDDQGFWTRRQEALARFGEQALRSDDLQVTLQEACRLAAQGLEAPISKVLVPIPEEGELLLRASVGIPASIAVPGVTRIHGETKSAAGYAIATGQPVISDLSRENRFDSSDIVKRIGATHSINVLIRAEDVKFGALEVDRVNDQRFTEADVDFLQSYANLLGAAVLRHSAMARINALLKEQELLFQELQHRIKNDFQVIVALIMLEQRRTQNFEAKTRLESIRSRVDSLRRVHDHLFARKSVSQVDLPDYLSELALARFTMHGLDPAGPIRLELDISKIFLDRDSAIAVGLMANEFLTNSLKYAFPTGSGVIRIVGEHLPGDRIRITFADNGVGTTSESAGTEIGSGFRIMELLARQLDAEIDRAASSGTRFSVTLRSAKPSAKAPTAPAS
jgi:two-component sensor histidine kinase